MTDAPLPGVDGSVPSITQVGFVVDDLEAAMRRYGRVLGVDPWLVYHYEPPLLSGTTYRGEPHDYTMRVALSDVGGPIDVTSSVLSPRSLERVLGWLASLRERLGLRPAAEAAPDERGLPAGLPISRLPGLSVELIEPVRGPSIYTDHLEERGPGVHHLGCFTYDDPHAVVERYVDAGFPVRQRGRLGDLEFWCLDTRDELDGLLFEVAANVWAMPEPDSVVSL